MAKINDKKIYLYASEIHNSVHIQNLGAYISLWKKQYFTYVARIIDTRKKKSSFI